MIVELNPNYSCDSLNPSQAKTILLCPLKFVFNKLLINYHPFLDNPSAILGSVIHEVIDTYYKNKNHSINFEEVWNKALQIQKIKYFKNPLNINNDPLEYWIPYYVIKKRMTELFVGGISHFHKNKTYHDVSFRTEQSLNYDFLTGRIDFLLKVGNNFVVRDFKSGSIYQYKKGKEPSLKPEYIEQLKTYGLLVKLNYNVPASSIKLSLVSIDGKESNTLLFGEAEYTAHYLLLRSKFDLVKQCSSLEQFQSLGEPQELICSLCKYRPVCTKYKNNLEGFYFINNTDHYIPYFTLKAGKDFFEINSSTGIIISNIPIAYYEPFTIFSSEKKSIFVYNLKRTKDTSTFYWTKYSNYFKEQIKWI